MINKYEGKKPKSLDLFLSYLNITEEEFYMVAMSHSVDPWRFDKTQYGVSDPLHDHDQWSEKPSLPRETAQSMIERCTGCNSCI